MYTPRLFKDLKPISLLAVLLACMGTLLLAGKKLRDNREHQLFIKTNRGQRWIPNPCVLDHRYFMDIPEIKSLITQQKYRDKAEILFEKLTQVVLQRLEHLEKDCLANNNLGGLTSKQFSESIERIKIAARNHCRARAFTTEVANNLALSVDRVRGSCDEAAFESLQEIALSQYASNTFYPVLHLQFLDSASNDGHNMVLLNARNLPSRNTSTNIKKFLRTCEKKNPDMKICDSWLNYTGNVAGWIKAFSQNVRYGRGIKRYTDIKLYSFDLPYHDYELLPQTLKHFVNEELPELIYNYKRNSLTNLVTSLEFYGTLLLTLSSMLLVREFYLGNICSRFKPF